MKSRLAHLTMLVLGAGGAVLSFLAKEPGFKYAGLAGALLLLVTDAKKAFGSVDAARPIAGLFALMLLGHSLFCCATTARVTAACVATAAQAQQILDKLGSSAVPSVAVAAVDALRLGCAVASEVDAFIAAHQTDAGIAFMTADDPMDARRLANAKAWRAAHP